MKKLTAALLMSGLAFTAQAATIEHTALAGDKNGRAVETTGLISVDNQTQFVSLSAVAGETSFTIPSGSETYTAGANGAFARCIEVTPTARCGASMVAQLGTLTSNTQSSWVVVPSGVVDGANLTEISQTTGGTVSGTQTPFKILVKAYSAAFNASFSFRKQ